MKKKVHELRTNKMIIKQDGKLTWNEEIGEGDELVENVNRLLQDKNNYRKRIWKTGFIPHKGRGGITIK